VSGQQPSSHPIPAKPGTAAPHDALARRPGSYLTRKVGFRLAILFGAVALALVAAGFAFGQRGLLGLWVCLGVIALLIAVSWLSEGRILDPFSYLKGMFGEEIVGHLLEALEPLGFLALHDVGTGRGNIDHVVVGPTGVFAIETKNWKGALTAAGDRLMHNGFDETRAITQVRAEAMTLRDRLRADGQDVWVEAVIVSVRGTVGPGRLDFPHASVVHAAYLASLIRDDREKLSAEQISQALAAVARLSETDRIRRHRARRKRR